MCVCASLSMRIPEVMTIAIPTSNRAVAAHRLAVWDRSKLLFRGVIDYFLRSAVKAPESVPSKADHVPLILSLTHDPSTR